jgi:hypothetical protein
MLSASRQFKLTRVILVLCLLLLWSGLSRAESCSNALDANPISNHPVIQQRLKNGNTLIQLNPSVVEDRMKPLTAGKQRESQWCWAACLQMALNFYGFNETQESIVEKVFGTQMNHVGSRSDLDIGVSGSQLPLSQHSAFVVRTLDIEFTERNIIDALSKAHPMVLGMKNQHQQWTGHDYLIIGAVMRNRSESDAEILSLKVINPSRHAQAIEFIPWASARSRHNRLLRLDLWLADRVW